jgi:glycogen debranching enzyme
VDPLSGFYVREVRHLHLLRFEVNGERPWLCEWARPSPEELAFVMVHPELAHFGGGGSGVAGDAVTRDAKGIPHRALDVRLTYRVELHRLRARAVVVNRSRAAISCALSWVFAADYADLIEVQDGERKQEAPVERHVEGRAVRLRYAHPELPFETTLVGEGPGQVEVGEDRWASRVDLGPGQAARLDLTVEAHDPALPLDDEARRARQRAHEAWQGSLTRIAVPGNALAEAVLDRARADLASFPLLEGDADEWLALQAGIPLYPAFFGRDALTAGWQAGLLDSGAMLDAALTRLGRLQSGRDFPWRDEEPGRIPYQVRTGPLARLGVNPYSAYYADFASPLMYAISLASLYAWTGRREDVDRHWATAVRILE